MKAVLKNVTIDNDNDALVTFAQTIDFAPLFEHVKAFTGVNCSFYQPEITTRGGQVYISFMSEDISPQTGVFAAILAHSYIHSFSNGVFSDKATGQPAYWVSVDIRYELKRGGSNGMEIFRAGYRRGEWEFSDVGETQK